jgi:hypothetical protein
MGAAVLLMAVCGCTMSVEAMLNRREWRDPQRQKVAVKELASVARNDEKRGRGHLRRRCVAVESMAYLDSDEAIGVLGDLGCSVRSPALRLRVAWALGQQHHTAAAEQLLRMAEHAARRETLARILEGLCRFPAYVASTRHRQDAALDVINRAQSRFPECSEINNLTGLLFGEIKSLPGCLRALESARKDEDLQKAFNALRWVGDTLLAHGERMDTEHPNEPYDRAIELLQELAAAAGEAREIRYRALWYLGMLAEPRTAPRLAEVATDGDRAARMLGIWALWRADRDAFNRRMSNSVSPDLLELTPANYLQAARELPDLPELEVERLIYHLKHREPPE